MSSKLTVTLEDDGTVRLDASQMDGTAEEILEELAELAADIGAEPVTVEKHVHRHGHHHTHRREIRGRT